VCAGPGPLLHVVDRPLERFVGEGLDLAAVVAHQVVVMLAALVARLVSGAAGAGVDALDEPVVHEEVEHAVDARDADGPSGGAQAVVQLLCRQAALLSGEELDHRMTRTAPPVAGLTQDASCVLCPGHGC
jgi:hypothetical protein